MTILSIRFFIFKNNVQFLINYVIIKRLPKINYENDKNYQFSAFNFVNCSLSFGNHKMSDINMKLHSFGTDKKKSEDGAAHDTS